MYNFNYHYFGITNYNIMDYNIMDSIYDVHYNKCL